MYLQPNNFDNKVSFAENCGNGLHISGLFESPTSYYRFLRPLKFLAPYTYRKDFQTLAGHYIFPISALGGREISVLTEEIAFFYKKWNWVVKAGVKNYIDPIRFSNYQALELGFWYHPKIMMKRGKLKQE